MLHVRDFKETDQLYTSIITRKIPQGHVSSNVKKAMR